ncbi:uncharacterized protein NECHADRAFT_98456 [Fusarium vanettenii 77-13-4]|uniref:Uncharacterized protein n=1 Tax=Fusarium vanettenii (strain ATCC MYA-4622 / CBS 123669 / FGSC 9596 / NRRL 45880 / 77-13-4) TaxID=660122 RepID=C7ZR96_FUSV7|nr:uncharacterized protein NECHADRAFT_98456 [Fusarium vanettenii 77-13-4]EEU33460.1 hypothetical protein NECHADRAFT_98456 [Fusarium vanettenii 77-13-4]
MIYDTVTKTVVFANALIPSEPNVGNLETALAYPDVSHAAVYLALLEYFRNLWLSASALDIEWTNINDVLNHAAVYAHHASDRVAVQLAKDYLPPLDVLLVWYAFMLDTDAYRAAYHAACRDREPHVPPRIQKLCFPWPAIRDVIDIEKIQFSLPRAAQTLFLTLSGQSADILTYLKSPPAYIKSGTLPFEVNLTAEVKKHKKFINEAHGLLWIRAPALNRSLARASSSALRSLTLGPGATDPGLRIRDDIPIFIHIPPPYTSSSSADPPAAMQGQLSSLSPGQLRQIQDDLGFYNAVKSARRRSEPLPTRPPIAAEKDAERIAKEKQKEARYLPGLNEYIKVLLDGKQKIRRQKHTTPFNKGTRPILFVGKLGPTAYFVPIRWHQYELDFSLSSLEFRTN